ncbi:MAG: peptidase S1 [Acidobacteria bacterium]|nr:MAG: peptidase S1 [Acidobacteriota bacterium]
MPLAAAGALVHAASMPPPAHAQATARRALPSPVEAPPAPDLIRLSSTIERLVARVRPAVVQVVTTAYLPGETAAPGALLATQHATGSGVLVTADGYIVTNAHVVEGARRVQVVLAPPGPEPSAPRSILKPPGRALGAQVVGFDHESDLALLKVVETGLPFLSLGDSEALRQGQIVIALGSPMGLEGSVTLGVVSAVIQTDAPINPGNSGGPLLDAEGQVVGINSFILTQSGGSEGIGFAAPSNIVRTVVDQLRKAGRVRRGEIGIVAQTITPTLAAGLGLGQAWGVVLADVHPDGPGARAGLRVGDIVLSLDGKVTENARQFLVNLYPHTVGDTVVIEVRRGTERRKVPVAVVERPSDPARLADLVTPERNVIARLGILGLDLDDALLRMLGPLRAQAGVVVAAAAPDSGSVQDPLRPGDVIYTLNQQSVTSVEYLRGLLAKLSVGEPVVLHVEREGELRFIGFEISEPAPASP